MRNTPVHIVLCTRDSKIFLELEDILVQIGALQKKEHKERMEADDEAGEATFKTSGKPFHRK